MRLWSFDLKITRRDKVLLEIDEVLSEIGVNRTGVEGVRELAEYFRRADVAARGARRRVSELEASVLEYERALRGIQAVEREAQSLAFSRQQAEATPIERMARDASGVDLPLTQRTAGLAPCRSWQSQPHGLTDRGTPTLSGQSISQNRKRTRRHEPLRQR